MVEISIEDSDRQFYYQLKVKMKTIYCDGIGLEWSSPVMRGIVRAKDSKSARKKIKEEIFEKDIKRGDDILLSIIEVKEDTQYLLDFFKPRVCKYCGRTFDIATTETFGRYGDFCSKVCFDLYNYDNFDFSRYIQSKDFNALEWTECNPVIYRIHNRKSDKNYVGQTIRAFTLRWWEHYKTWIGYCPDGKITDFDFSVLEEFSKEDVRKNDKLLSEREQYWIDYYNALDENKGYNSRREVAGLKPKKVSIEDIKQGKLW